MSTIEGSSKDMYKGKTLIVPSVSLANLPQLAVDLLITSLRLRRVGPLGSGDTVVPFFGYGDDGRPVTGGLEIYASDKSPVVVIQQRSPTIKSKKDDQVELLKDWIIQSQFESTIILTSIDAASQDDVQLLTPHQSILPPHPTPSTTLHQLTALLPPLTLHLDPALHSINPSFSSESTSTPYPPFLPAAGLTRRLLAAFHQNKLVHGCVSAWCVEGDNRGDARALAQTVLKVIGQDEVKILEPDSWKGLFGAVEGWSGGSGLNAEIYG